MTSLLPLILLTVLLFLFFTYKLTEVPSGINLDEVQYGYNGILLANTWHDQNGRFLPPFILDPKHEAWYPPYMQYLIVISFKIFGPSIWALRLPTAILSTLSAFLIFYLAKLIWNQKTARLSLLAFVITPEVLIETHSALEHIIVIPFTTLWLIFLWKYQQDRNKKYLIMAALTLGFGFYSYAGIRPEVVIWTLLTIGYVAYLNWSKVKQKIIQPLLYFLISLLPFLVVIPFLEKHFSGAIFYHQTFQIPSIYNFLYYFLASFDPSFLFLSGDKLLVQSTGHHGMFLLASLPILAVGIYQALQKRQAYFNLLIITFFLSPLLLGFVGSAFFAHRLMYMIPLYCLFFTLGFLELMKLKSWFKVLSLSLILLVAINFLDFWHYYMFDYPKDTYHIFYHIKDLSKPY